MTGTGIYNCEDMYLYMVAQLTAKLKALNEEIEKLDRSYHRAKAGENTRLNKGYFKTMLKRRMRKRADIQRVLDKMTPKLYRRLISEYNQLMMIQVFQGQRWRLGKRMGAIQAVMCERSFKKPTAVDWAASRKMWEATGERKGVVRFTDDYYPRIVWRKSFSTATNKTVYRFDLTRGQNGNTRKFVTFMKENPEVKDRYQVWHLHYHKFTPEERRKKSSYG